MILILSVVTQRLIRLNKSALTHSFIQHSETVSNSKKLQTTTEMWLFRIATKDFKIQLHRKYCGER